MGKNLFIGVAVLFWGATGEVCAESRTITFEDVSRHLDEFLSGREVVIDGSRYVMCRHHVVEGKKDWYGAQLESDETPVGPGIFQHYKSYASFKVSGPGKKRTAFTVCEKKSWLP